MARVVARGYDRRVKELSDNFYGSPNRPVYWLLGLPFDNVDIAGAGHIIEKSASAGDPLVFATPNVNFLALADKNEEFRRNILEADLSLIDGMVLVWLGRLLGAPFRERVAGSSLIEHLLSSKTLTAIKVFFLGGESNVSEVASNMINASASALSAVGALNPGFGSIDELSTNELIDRVNASGADFLIVALGAEKGHAWISRNRARLHVPIVSHLGATVNFLAGTLRRAPIILQNLGLEWAWRIGQEPKLATRYWRDGLFLLKCLIVSVIPVLICRVLSSGHDSNELSIYWDARDDRRLNLKGRFLEQSIARLRETITATCCGTSNGIEIDLSQVTAFDCRSLGFLYELRYRNGTRTPIRITGRSRRLSKLLARFRAEAIVE